MNYIAILFIKIYQKFFSKYAKENGRNCLHYPSCSNYAILAFKRYKFIKAFELTYSRYNSCHPYSGRPYIDYPQ